ncbi:abortive infection family protein [Dysgonomonas sp. 511]|uniref:abortive infection family protein n=1 Tax=Dysgonomonas sp. 511 TaxID=2302930 RepID=UPI0013D58053|nr:abortive infection family protein [Dysgonomonas sp. 511]NDV77487.1 hypothetical protein [Dysgonomonas sp. 511]
MDWTREHITKMPSFGAFEAHVLMIEESIETNASLCIETCKSLIEGICKTILTNKNIIYKQSESFQGLVRKTVDTITPSCYNNEKIRELSRRIAAVSQTITEIRNDCGFASHGKDIKEPPIDRSLSLLTYKITDVLGGFILHYYIKYNKPQRNSRIHYEDCQMFNEYFDYANPLVIGLLSLSASEALYQQDYQAYREEYLYYLESKDEFDT